MRFCFTKWFRDEMHQEADRQGFVSPSVDQSIQPSCLYLLAWATCVPCSYKYSCLLISSFFLLQPAKKKPEPSSLVLQFPNFYCSKETWQSGHHRCWYSGADCCQTASGIRYGLCHPGSQSKHSWNDSHMWTCCSCIYWEINVIDMQGFSQCTLLSIFMCILRK